MLVAVFIPQVSESVSVSATDAEQRPFRGGLGGIMTSVFKSRFVRVIVTSAVLLAANSARAQKVVVDADPAHVANTFSPVRSLGAAIDRLRTGTPDKLLKDPLLKEILGAGWQTVTYRQNTELMVEAWHWNPAGKWSNADKQEGYFAGNAEPAAEIHSSWAYPLPHRGFSRGDGNGWSRLTDGDPKSYWKSNPYLTKAAGAPPPDPARSSSLRNRCTCCAASPRARLPSTTRAVRHLSSASSSSGPT